MRGEIRIGTWKSFTAHQILSPDGFIWAATAGRFPMRISGSDRYTNGTGEMRWRMFGVVPVMTASGPDTTRSSAGRHASEAVALVPGAAFGPDVVWSGIDDDRAIATIAIGAFTHDVTIDVDEYGALRTVTLPRWGSPDKNAHQIHTFGVMCEAETTFGGYTVPSTMRAGWWLGTERWAQGEFFRCRIEHAEFF